MSADLQDTTAAELFELAEANKRCREARQGSLRHPCGLRVIGADLAQIDLHGLHFDDSRFEACRLQGAVLFDGTFSDTVLTDCDLSGADLVKMEIHQTDLRGCRFDGARLIKATMIDCDLRGASFEGADLTSAVISGCQLEGANFDRAILTYALLEANSGQPVALPQQS